MEDNKMLETPETVTRILNAINNTALREFIQNYVGKYSNDDKVIEANKIGDIVIASLIRDGHIQPNQYMQGVDIVLSATMLHNIYYDRSDITTLLKLRREIYKEEIPDTVYPFIAPILETVEAQDGMSCPVPKLSPDKFSMAKYLAESKWFYDTFLK